MTEKRRPSAHKRGYDRRWSEYSKSRLLRFPLCEGLRVEMGGAVVINTHPGRVAEAVLTDHIVPHKGNMDMFRNPANHQSACEACHNTKTASEDGGWGRTRQASLRR